MKKELVVKVKGIDCCDSQMVAKKFNVQHAKVIRTIERLLEKMNKLNASFPGRIEKEEMSYNLTKFTTYKMDKAAAFFIVSRLKSKDAFEWTIAAINAMHDDDTPFPVIEKTYNNSSVYVAQNMDNLLIKIGHSSDVNKRIKDLEMLEKSKISLISSFPGGKELEGKLHIMCDKFRVRGEWFTPDVYYKVLDFLVRSKGNSMVGHG